MRKPLYEPVAQFHAADDDDDDDDDDDIKNSELGLFLPNSNADNFLDEEDDYEEEDEFDLNNFYGKWSEEDEADRKCRASLLSAAGKRVRKRAANLWPVGPGRAGVEEMAAGGAVAFRQEAADMADYSAEELGKTIFFNEKGYFRLLST